MKTILLLALLTGLFASRPMPGSSVLAPPTTCTMTNGQPRPFACEFRIVTLRFKGKNDEPVGSVTASNQAVVLPKSKAVIDTQSVGNETFTYNVTVNFVRVNPPSFLPKPLAVALNVEKFKFYEVNTSRVDFPISPGELTVVTLVDVDPKVPLIRREINQVTFPLQITYSTGSNGTIIAPVQYVQIANPITFTKFPQSINQYRDRAEAFIVFHTTVDVKH